MFDISDSYRKILILFAETVKPFSGGWFQPAFLPDDPSFDGPEEEAPPFIPEFFSPYTFLTIQQAIDKFEEYLLLCENAGIPPEKISTGGVFLESPAMFKGEVLSSLKKVPSKGLHIVELLPPDVDPVYNVGTGIIFETMPLDGYHFLPTVLDPVAYARSEIVGLEMTQVMIFYNGEVVFSKTFDPYEDLPFDLISPITDKVEEILEEMSETEGSGDDKD